MSNLEYDHSGRWPWTPDGWQIVPIDRYLFPGGPLGFRVNSPEDSFYFGMHFEPLQGEPCRAVVTDFGRSSARGRFDYVLTSPDRMSTAQLNVREYLLAFAKHFHDWRFDAVEFRLGSAQLVDIF